MTAIPPDDLVARSRNWTDLTLTRRQLSHLELIAGGWLPGLSSFMGPDDIAGLPDGGAAAITLDVPAAFGTAALGTIVALRDPEGVLLAGLEVSDVMPRPGRASGEDTVALHGTLTIVQTPIHYDHPDLRMSVDELMATIGDGRTILAVPTVAPISGQGRVTAQQVATDLDAPVVVMSLVGDAAPDDSAIHTLIRANRLTVARMRQELNRPVAHVALPIGPPGEDPQAVLVSVLGQFSHPLVDGGLAAALRDVATPQVWPADRSVGALTPAPLAALDDDVAQLVGRRARSAATDGLTLFFTGLSGSGKSTVANAVMARLHAETDRRITMLDGDLVRRHLSSELTFSREHRDLNITRIGFVAAEVTKHGGLAICAPIAPYAATRQAVADMVNANGTFLLVHVATPLEVCEARDRKGLYAKARAGEIPSFTGISDPYEAPTDADLVLDTSEGTVAQAAEQVMAMLQSRGFITGDPGAEGRVEDLDGTG